MKILRPVNVYFKFIDLLNNNAKTLRILFRIIKIKPATIDVSDFCNILASVFED